MQKIKDERLKLKNLHNIRITYGVQTLGILGILIYEWVTKGIDGMTKNPLWFVFILTSIVSAFLSMDIGVRETAKKMIHGDQISEGLKNQLEMIIRAYDPCLSCATHAIDGSSPLEVEIYDLEGKLISKQMI